jgi:hypothetical protein
MIGMYVLVALISQFASGELISPATWQPATVEAVFDSLDHSYLRTAVTYRGTQVGEVSRVRSEDRGVIVAQLNISPLHRRKLPRALVAIATSKPSLEGKNRIPAIELIPNSDPASAKPTLLGCPSFSAYWANNCQASQG